MRDFNELLVMDSDEEIFDTRSCYKSKVAMSSVSQKQILDPSEITKTMLETKPYVRRKESDNTNINRIDLLNENNNVEELCKVFCKPVSVSLTKLPTLDGKGQPIKKLSKTRAERKKKRKKRFKLSRKKSHIMHARKKTKQSRTSDPCGIEDHVQTQIVVVRKKRMTKNRKSHTKNVLRNIKQPYIKLHRIDDMINKIAQSLAKVSPNKEDKINGLTAENRKTRSRQEKKLITPKISALTFHSLALHTDRNDSSTTESISGTNENIQPGQHTCNNSNTLCNINNRQTLKRRRNDTFTNDGANSDFCQIISEETKRLRLDSLKQEPETLIKIKRDDSYPDLATSTAERGYMIKISANVCDELRLLSANEFNDVFEKIEYGNTIEINKEGCASNYVPLELNPVNTLEDNICPKSKKNNSTNVEESSLENNKSQNQKPELLTSDKDLIRKYKLFKELRVSLIKFDSINGSSNNTYSAREMEHLIEKYAKTLQKVTSVHTTELPLLDTINESIVEIEQADKLSGTEKSTSVPISSTEFRTDASSVKCIVDRRNVNEKLASIVKPVSSMSPCLSKTVKMQQDRSLENPNISIFGTGFRNDCSERRDEEIARGNLEQELIPETRANSSISDKASTKGPTSSSIIKDTVNKIKSKDTSNKCSTKSANKVLIPLSKGKKLNSLFSNEKFEKLLRKARLSKAVDTKKCTRSVAKPSSFQDESFISRKHTFETTSPSSGSSNMFTIYNSTITSPTKYKKSVDKEDSNKGNKSSVAYKCIVCDSSFGEYSILQQHLSKHTQGQTTLSFILPKLPTVENTSAAVKQQTKSLCLKQKETNLPQSSNEEILVDPAPTSSKNEKKKKSLQQKVSPKKDVKIKGQCENRMKNNVSRKIKSSKFTNECTMCLQVFSSKTELADHIYMHTENELQEAYRIEKEKLEKMNKESNEKKLSELKLIEAKNVTNNRIDDGEKSSKVSNEKDRNCSESSVIRTHNGSIMEDFQTRTVAKETVTSKLEASKSIVLDGSECKTVQPFPVQNKSEKEKINKVGHIRKKFTVCQCHNKSETSLSYLQIEIILLCHVCRVLFRTMECFETHYRLFEYAACNQNRLDSSRSPYLFCASCGMLCSSAEDLHEHLKAHYRFKQMCTMDFRCNICKVMFIGIGSLFYAHWSKHVKEPFWVSSEQSFPKTCVIHIKSNGEYKQNECGSSRFTDTFIQIAENICSNCRLPFLTEEYLKAHKLTCNEPNRTTNTTVQPYVITQKYPIRLICSLCGGVYFDKFELYRHMRIKHDFGSKPQVVRMVLTTTRTVFICSVCMEASDSMDDFEIHWFRHYTSRPYLTCTFCETNCSSVISYLDHAKVHGSKMKEDILSCKVNYRKCDFICQLCNIGFDCEKSLNDHEITHNIMSRIVQPENNAVSDQKKSTFTPETNNILKIAKLNKLNLEKLKEKLTQEGVNKGDQAIEKNAHEYWSQLSRNRDGERVVNILEENEEDSENELVIDLSEQSTADRDHASIPASNVQTCTVSENTGYVVTTAQLSNGATQITRNVVLSSKDTITPRNDTLNKNISESSVQVSSALTNNSNHFQTISSANKEMPITAETDDSVKPKQGLLRVKNIAELIGNTDSSHLCHICRYAFKCSDDLIRHVLIHTNQNQQDNKHQVSRNRVSVNQNSSPRPSTSSNTWNYGTPTNSNQQLASTDTTKINNHRLQSQLNTNQGRCSNSSQQTSQSAYHKNLPPCNVLQRIVVPRYSNQKRNEASTRAAVNSVEGISYPWNIQATSTISCSDDQCQNTSKWKGDSNIFLPKLNEVSLTSNDQHYKQPLRSTPNHSEINHVTATVLHQNLNLAPNDLSNCIQGPTRREQMEFNQSAIGNMSTSFHYQNTSAGGMVVVINETTPTVSTMPSVEMLQGHLHQQQQQIYQQLVHNDQYIEQPQNVIDYSGSNDCQMLTNQDGAQIRQNVTTHKISQQSPQLICAYCPKPIKFISEESFKLHVHSYHGTPCDICGMRLKGFRELNSHRMKH
ncbi:uncharacterized protein LOC128872929 [Hylaeus volcanicus]|uniref:uncharacterized protein LOC128872929 n=1 Tax=Hylaeus volcanicus TaxID=313075 RepID=UPI0023B7744E|nr:uncharacterized protein LOC128872929 [Hylaeus volcanicus]XP_053972094.1 uncharacterized protein LOC128872929 [Hylaeus volcanicus]